MARCGGLAYSPAWKGVCVKEMVHTYGIGPLYAKYECKFGVHPCCRGAVGQMNGVHPPFRGGVRQESRTFAIHAWGK